MPEPREDLGRPVLASSSVKKQVCQTEVEQGTNVDQLKRQMSFAPCGERLKGKVSCLRRNLSKSSPDISSSSSSSDWSFDEPRKGEVRNMAGEEHQDQRSMAYNLVWVLPSQLPHTSTDFSQLSARWPMMSKPNKILLSSFQVVVNQTDNMKHCKSAKLS